jgi:hypothetical protein
MGQSQHLGAGPEAASGTGVSDPRGPAGESVSPDPSRGVHGPGGSTH